MGARLAPVGPAYYDEGTDVVDQGITPRVGTEETRIGQDAVAELHVAPTDGEETAGEEVVWFPVECVADGRG